MNAKKDVALVLSGGGARGIAHIGVIEELERREYNITSVAGTSMGSVIGGVYALGKMEVYKNWLCSLDKIEVFRLFDLSFSNLGLIKGEKVFKKMKEFIPDKDIEKLSIPFTATAVDLKYNKEVVFRKGSIYEALRASIAIPTVIRPVFKNGSILVDGGVLNNIPINNVQRKTNDILVAVNVNANIKVQIPEIFKKEKEKQLSLYQKRIQEFKKYIDENHEKQTKEEHLNYLEIISKTIHLMINKIAETNLKKYPPDILVETSDEACGTFEFHKAKEMVEIGRYAAKKKLDEYEYSLV